MKKELIVLTVEQFELLLDRAYIKARIETIKDLENGKQYI